MGCIQHNGVHQDAPRDLIIVDMLDIRQLSLQLVIAIPHKKIRQEKNLILES